MQDFSIDFLEILRRRLDTPPMMTQDGIAAHIATRAHPGPRTLHTHRAGFADTWGHKIAHAHMFRIPLWGSHRLS